MRIAKIKKKAIESKRGFQTSPDKIVNMHGQELHPEEDLRINYQTALQQKNIDYFGKYQRQIDELVAKYQQMGAFIFFLFAQPLLNEDTKETIGSAVLDFGTEIAEMRSIFKETKQGAGFKNQHMTEETLVQTISSNSQILHISCHGYIDEDGKHNLGIESKLGYEHKLYSQAFDSIIKKQDGDIINKLKMHKVIFLSACHSEDIGKMLSKNVEEVPIIAIDSSEGINDQAAILFAKHFYQQIFAYAGDNQKGSVIAAFREAKQKVLEFKEEEAKKFKIILNTQVINEETYDALEQYDIMSILSTAVLYTITAGNIIDSNKLMNRICDIECISNLQILLENERFKKIHNIITFIASGFETNPIATQNNLIYTKNQCQDAGVLKIENDGKLLLIKSAQEDSVLPIVQNTVIAYAVRYCYDRNLIVNALHINIFEMKSGQDILSKIGELLNLNLTEKSEQGPSESDRINELIQKLNKVQDRTIIVVNNIYSQKMFKYMRHIVQLILRIVSGLQSVIVRFIIGQIEAKDLSKPILLDSDLINEKYLKIKEVAQIITGHYDYIPEYQSDEMLIQKNTRFNNSSNMQSSMRGGSEYPNHHGLQTNFGPANREMYELSSGDFDLWEYDNENCREYLNSIINKKIRVDYQNNEVYDNLVKFSYGSYKGQVEKSTRIPFGIGVFESEKIIDEKIIQYVGMRNRGIRHGLGKLNVLDSFFYEGNWMASMMHGFGTLTYPDGSIFTGFFNENKRWGRGILIIQSQEQILIGSFVNDVLNGPFTALSDEGSEQYKLNFNNGELIPHQGKICGYRLDLGILSTDEVFYVPSDRHLEIRSRDNSKLIEFELTNIPQRVKLDHALAFYKQWSNYKIFKLEDTFCKLIMFGQMDFVITTYIHEKLPNEMKAKFPQTNVGGTKSQPQSNLLLFLRESTKTLTNTVLDNVYELDFESLIQHLAEKLITIIGEENQAEEEEQKMQDLSELEGVILIKLKHLQDSAQLSGILKTMENASTLPAQLPISYGQQQYLFRALNELEGQKDTEASTQKNDSKPILMQQIGKNLVHLFDDGTQSQDQLSILITETIKLSVESVLSLEEKGTKGDPNQQSFDNVFQTPDQMEKTLGRAKSDFNAKKGDQFESEVIASQMQQMTQDEQEDNQLYGDSRLQLTSIFKTQKQGISSEETLFAKQKIGKQELQVIVKELTCNELSRESEEFIAQQKLHQSLPNHDILPELIWYSKIGIQSNDQNSLLTYCAYKSIEGPTLKEYFTAQSEVSFHEKWTRFFFRDLVNGLDHFHSNRVAGLDLDSSKILISKDTLKLKIVDFSSAKKFSSSQVDEDSFQNAVKEDYKRAANLLVLMQFKKELSKPDFETNCGLVRNGKIEDFWTILIELQTAYKYIPVKKLKKLLEKMLSDDARKLMKISTKDKWLKIDELPSDEEIQNERQKSNERFKSGRYIRQGVTSQDGINLDKSNLEFILDKELFEGFQARETDLDPLVQERKPNMLGEETKYDEKQQSQNVQTTQAFIGKVCTVLGPNRVVNLFRQLKFARTPQPIVRSPPLEEFEDLEFKIEYYFKDKNALASVFEAQQTDSRTADLGRTMLKLVLFDSIQSLGIAGIDSSRVDDFLENSPIWIILALLNGFAPLFKEESLKQKAIQLLEEKLKGEKDSQSIVEGDVTTQFSKQLDFLVNVQKTVRFEETISSLNTSFMSLIGAYYLENQDDLERTMKDLQPIFILYLSYIGELDNIKMKQLITEDKKIRPPYKMNLFKTLPAKPYELSAASKALMNPDLPLFKSFNYGTSQQSASPNNQSPADLGSSSFSGAYSQSQDPKLSKWNSTNEAKIQPFNQTSLIEVKSTELEGREEEEEKQEQN